MTATRSASKSLSTSTTPTVKGDGCKLLFDPQAIAPLKIGFSTSLLPKAGQCARPRRSFPNRAKNLAV
jgi:hypothetical protein